MELMDAFTYSHAQKMIFCGIGVFAISILIGWLGVYILHRGVLTTRKSIMYLGWGIAGIGCILYVLGWLIMLRNNLVPDGPGSYFDKKAMLMLPLAVTIGICYGAKDYSQKHDDYRTVADTSYVLALFVGFAPIIMLMFF